MDSSIDGRGQERGVPQRRRVPRKAISWRDDALGGCSDGEQSGSAWQTALEGFCDCSSSGRTELALVWRRWSGLGSGKSSSRLCVRGAEGLDQGLSWKLREHVNARSDPVLESFPYVLVGTGPAVLAAAAKIREVDPTGEILILGEQRSVPYTRQDLAKYLLGKESEISS